MDDIPDDNNEKEEDVVESMEVLNDWFHHKPGGMTS